MTKNGAFRRLNRRLQSLARKQHIRAKLKGLAPHTAESEWNTRGIKMIIDTDTVGKVPAFLHELLHWHYEKIFEDLEEDIEEAMVQALEDKLVSFLLKDKRRVDYWRRVIRRII